MAAQVLLCDKTRVCMCLGTRVCMYVRAQSRLTLFKLTSHCESAGIIYIRHATLRLKTAMYPAPRADVTHT